MDFLQIAILGIWLLFWAVVYYVMYRNTRHQSVLGTDDYSARRRSADDPAPSACSGIETMRHEDIDFPNRVSEPTTTDTHYHGITVSSDSLSTHFGSDYNG